MNNAATLTDEDDTLPAGESALTGDLAAYVAEASKKSRDIVFTTEEGHLNQALLLHAPLIENHEEGAQSFCAHITEVARAVFSASHCKALDISMHISPQRLEPPDVIETGAYLLFDSVANFEQQWLISPHQPMTDRAEMRGKAGIAVLVQPAQNTSHQTEDLQPPAPIEAALQQIEELKELPDFLDDDSQILDLILGEVASLMESGSSDAVKAQLLLDILMGYGGDDSLPANLRFRLRALAQKLQSHGSAPLAARDMPHPGIANNAGAIGGPALAPPSNFPRLGIASEDQPRIDTKEFTLSDGVVIPVTMWAPGGRGGPAYQGSQEAAANAAGASYAPPVVHYDTAKYPDQPAYQTQKFGDPTSWNQSTGLQIVAPGDEKALDGAIRDMWLHGDDPTTIAMRLNVPTGAIIERAKWLYLGPPGLFHPPQTRYPDQQNYTLDFIADPAAEAPGYEKGYAVPQPRPVENRATHFYAEAANYAAVSYAAAGYATQAALVQPAYAVLTAAPVARYGAAAYALPLPGAVQNAPVVNYTEAAASAAPRYGELQYAEASPAPAQNFAASAPSAVPGVAEPVSTVPAATATGPGSLAAPETPEINYRAITQSDIEPPALETEAPEAPEPEQSEQRSEPERPEIPERREEPEPQQNQAEPAETAHNVEEFEESGERMERSSQSQETETPRDEPRNANPDENPRREDAAQRADNIREADDRDINNQAASAVPHHHLLAEGFEEAAQPVGTHLHGLGPLHTVHQTFDMTGPVTPHHITVSPAPAYPDMKVANGPAPFLNDLGNHLLFHGGITHAGTLPAASLAAAAGLSHPGPTDTRPAGFYAGLTINPSVNASMKSPVARQPGTVFVSPPAPAAQKTHFTNAPASLLNTNKHGWKEYHDEMVRRTQDTPGLSL